MNEKILKEQFQKKIKKTRQRKIRVFTVTMIMYMVVVVFWIIKENNEILNVVFNENTALFTFILLLFIVFANLYFIINMIRGFD